MYYSQQLTEKGGTGNSLQAMLLKLLRPGETLVRYVIKTMRRDKNGDVNKQAERCMFTAKQKNKNKNKTKKQKTLSITAITVVQFVESRCSI